MKKLLAILLAILCVSTLFVGCGERTEKKAEEQPKKASFNFGGNGLEFGMTKEEVNKIGREKVSAFADNFDIDNVICSDLITQKSFKDIFTYGVTEDLYPKVYYYFDDNDKLYCVKFWAPLISENAAETMLNNVMETYGEKDKYDEKDGYSIDIGTMYEFTYEDKDIQVLIAFEHSDLADDFNTLNVYLTAPGYEPPEEEE